MSIQFSEQNNVKEIDNTHTNKNWKKLTQNVILILIFGSGKVILWKWCFVGNLKDAQELFKSRESLHEFRMVNG